MINIISPDFSDLPGCRSLPRQYKQANLALKDPLVSIITPYYNTEEFFVETFVSLQAQSLQNWEWIIVDDGSTDEHSINRLTNVANKDRRIKVIRQKNAGPAAARNVAFSNSTARYICLIDSDDMVEPTYLEKCVWFLESNQEFSFCNSYSVIFGDEERLWSNGFERGSEHLQANSGPPISVIRRMAYKECGGFDESIHFGHEDWDFWLAMANAGHWGHTIQEYLQWYRKRCNGRFEQIMCSDGVNEEFERMVQQKYEGLDDDFPQPCRQLLYPYQGIKTSVPLFNQLAPNLSDGSRRILFLLPWMVTGGADRVNLDLIEGLTSRGHDITICATLQAVHDWEHQFSRFTPDIFVLPNFLSASDFPRFIIYLIQSRQIDTVLITGSTIGYQVLPYIRSVCPNVAFIDMCHVEEPHWLNGGHPRFAVGYQDAIDLNIVTTNHLSKWMQRRGADGERIRLMYTGVRAVNSNKYAEVRKAVREELNISSEMPVIVFAGRICKQKRPGMLAKILKGILQQNLKFRALIIGDGEQREEFEGLLSQYELNANVQMLGSVSHQKWLEILVASDIFLMPSEYEGISVALLEAIASGVVPVVAKVGGQEEIVTQDIGVLVQHGDNELKEYVDVVYQLVSNPKELKQKSKQCLELASSKLSWEVMIDHFWAILDDTHQQKIGHQLNPISSGLAKEWASMSLELIRLGETVNHLGNTNKHLVDHDLEYLKQCLGEKERHLSEVINSGRWKLINSLSAPYRKIKERFLNKKRAVIKE